MYLELFAVKSAKRFALRQRSMYQQGFFYEVLFKKSHTCHWNQIGFQALQYQLSKEFRSQIKMPTLQLGGYLCNAGYLNIHWGVTKYYKNNTHDRVVLSTYRFHTLYLTLENHLPLPQAQRRRPLLVWPQWLGKHRCRCQVFC